MRREVDALDANEVSAWTLRGRNTARDALKCESKTRGPGKSMVYLERRRSESMESFHS